MGKEGCEVGVAVWFWERITDDGDMSLMGLEELEDATVMLGVRGEEVSGGEVGSVGI